MMEPINYIWSETRKYRSVSEASDLRWFISKGLRRHMNMGIELFIRQFLGFEYYNWAMFLQSMFSCLIDG